MVGASTEATGTVGSTAFDFVFKVEATFLLNEISLAAVIKP